MRKTVEIEYVGIEDVQDIMDDAYALMRLGHYVDMEMSSVTGIPGIHIRIQLGEFDSSRDYDYEYHFYMTQEKEDVYEMHCCKDELRQLFLKEE